MNANEVSRMHDRTPQTNPIEGKVVWSPLKSLWFTTHALIALVGGYLTFNLNVVLFSFLIASLILWLGSIGFHRLLIHRSFKCPAWLEMILVYAGTLVGMGGPFKILYMHDIRDWSQRHGACHPYFIDQHPLWRDFLWQIHCEIRLTHPPRFEIEPSVANSRFYQFLDRYWMLQQLPWAILFYALGGISFIIWGISIRIVASTLGHWFVGYLAHNIGHRDWYLHDHAVQGYNVPYLSLITMGEAWHNNHHAFPGSARFGLNASQWDPGWWMLCLLRSGGLIWDIKLPADLPPRTQLIRIGKNTSAKKKSPQPPAAPIRPALISHPRL